MASIRRFMAWMSATAAKSRPRRQTNGRIASRNAAPKRQVPGHRARLDHRRALPVLAHALVVGDGGGQRDGGRGRRRIGAQPQIGAEDVAVGVARLHQRHQTAREPRGEAALGIPLGAFGVYWRRRVVQQHEVHIGGIVQFARAELAHAEHREPAAASRIVRVRQPQFPGVVRGPQQMGDREGQRGLGQVAQRRGDLLQPPDPADVGDRGRQRDDPLGPAQRRRDLLAPAVRRAARAAPPEHRPPRAAAPARRARADARGLAHREVRQIRAVAAERRQQGLDRQSVCTSRASVRPSSAKRSIRRSAAAGSCGAGQAGAVGTEAGIGVKIARNAIALAPCGRGVGGAGASNRGRLRLAPLPRSPLPQGEGVVSRSLSTRLLVSSTPREARFHHHAARGAGLVLHRLATVALGTAVILSVLLAAAAWRLSQGPVDLRLVHPPPGSGRQCRRQCLQAVDRHHRAGLGRFPPGVDRPLDLRLTDIRLTDTSGVRHVDIPRAEVSLSLGALLLGRVQPRALELDDPRADLAPRGRTARSASISAA